MTWKTLIPYTPSDLHLDNDFVYDWRLGVPAFSQLVALRLTLMLIEDPNYGTDFRFKDELTAYSDALLQQIQLIQDGIRCSDFIMTLPDQIDENTPNGNTNWEVWHSCADINTGINVTRVNSYPGNTYPLDGGFCLNRDNDGNLIGGVDAACEKQRDIDYSEFYRVNITDPARDDRTTVMNQTPLTGLYKLESDVLSLANGGVVTTSSC